MKINLNTVGLYLVLLLLILVSLHQEILKLFVYYREVFGLVFILLLFVKRSSNIFHSMLYRKVFVENLLLILFPLIIILVSFFDPMVELYGDSLSVGITAYDGNVNPKLYVFRNAVLYLPMVFYIAVRGLSPSDINKIAVTSALIAPFSITIFLGGLSDSSAASEFVQIINGKLMQQYNTFVPCFTMSVLSIVYLMEFQKYTLLFKMILLVILVFALVFIFYSTSRQALLLSLIYIGIFTVIKNYSISKLKSVIYFAILCVALYFIYVWISQNYGANDRLLSKMNSSMYESRFQIMRDGLAMLKLSEFFTGVGLTSVLVSGPHNDYIRWVQRFGLIFTFISFYPYLSAMFKSFIDAISNKNDRVHLYIFCASLFIIFNSVFGYPREDAYQAIWCFLAISMWLGYNNFNRRRRDVEKSKSHPLVN